MKRRPHRPSAKTDDATDSLHDNIIATRIDRLLAACFKSDDELSLPAPVKTQEHLLLWGDEVQQGGWVANASGLVAKTHAPVKTGIMAVVADQPWEVQGGTGVIAGYNSITQANATDFRAYYDVLGPKGRFLCVALSKDGIVYTKPSLGLFTYDHSAQNNIVAVIWVPSSVPNPLPPTCAGAYPRPIYCIFPKMIGTVYFDADAPPSERFKFIGHYTLSSADGFAWNFLPGSSKRSHLPFSDTQIAAFFDPHSAQYSIYYRTHAHTKGFRTGRCPGPNETHSLSVQSPQRSVGLLVTRNISAESWGPADKPCWGPPTVCPEPTAEEVTVLEVDENDPPCMDLYTSGAIRVADATFAFPMQYLHCNTGRRVPVGHGREFPISAPIPCAPYRPIRPIPCSPWPSCSGLLATNDGLLDVGFAASRDGQHFQRFDRAPFLPRGEGQPRKGCAAMQNGNDECLGVWEGAFDAASTNVAVGIMDIGTDVTLMLGHGTQYTHGGYVMGNSTDTSRPPGGPVLSGLQVLKLGRHRFVSLRPVPSNHSAVATGSLLTRPLLLPNCTADRDGPQSLQLQLNIDIPLTGSATVEIQTNTDHLHSIVLMGNSAHLQVRFQQQQGQKGVARPTLPLALHGAVAQMLIRLSGTVDLYGFQFKCTTS